MAFLDYQNRKYSMFIAVSGNSEQSAICTFTTEEVNNSFILKMVKCIKHYMKYFCTQTTVVRILLQQMILTCVSVLFCVNFFFNLAPKNEITLLKLLDILYKLTVQHTWHITWLLWGYLSAWTTKSLHLEWHIICQIYSSQRSS